MNHSVVLLFPPHIVYPMIVLLLHFQNRIKWVARLVYLFVEQKTLTKLCNLLDCNICKRHLGQLFIGICLLSYENQNRTRHIDFSEKQQELCLHHLWFLKSPPLFFIAKYGCVQLQQHPTAVRIQLFALLFRSLGYKTMKVMKYITMKLSRNQSCVNSDLTARLH